MLRRLRPSLLQKWTRTVVTTRKAFTDLPNVHLRPDGTPAPPLTEWWAGGQEQNSKNGILEPDVKPVSKRRRKVADDAPPRKSRKKAQKDALSSRKTNLTDEEPTSDVSASPKRVAKKKSEEETTLPKKPRKRPKISADENAPQETKGAGLGQEVLENLKRFPHCILLTRVGKFYESYFHPAIEVARLLNIKLAQRRSKDGTTIPFCGFPLQHIDKYLKVLVQQHRRFVALCEEFPRYGPHGVVGFDRHVARVVTPGTLIDESFLNQYENNYLLAISHADADAVGLAWIDVSTGEFYSKSATYDILRDELARIGPREIVLDKGLESQKPPQLERVLAEELHCTSYIAPSAEEETPIDMSLPVNAVESTQSATALVSTTPVDDVTAEAPFPPVLSEYTPQERTAISLLTTYLHANLLEYMPQLSLPAREGGTARMQIDSHTIKALEIRESIREGGVKGSLLSVVKRTSTSSGTRLLARWLCSPSTSIPEINARQALVAFFHARDHFRADLVAALTSAEDAGRIVQRFLLGRGDPSDLHAVNSAIQVWTALKTRIAQEREQEVLEAEQRQAVFEITQWASLDALMARMHDLQELSQRIGGALKRTNSSKDVSQPAVDSDDAEDEGSLITDTVKPVWKLGNYDWAIRPEFSEKLVSLHAILDELLRRRERLQADLQLRYDASSLTLRSSPAHGMHVHLLKAKRDGTKLEQDPDFVSIAASGTTKCYFYQEWAQLGGQIVETTVALVAAEKEAFESLRLDVNRHASQLRRNARILDELDVTLAFANLAKEMNLVQPILTDEPLYDVVNGRHPTVELGLLTNGRVFTPNSVHLAPNSRLHIITGPNMAGKSTLLRQTALITVLAQTGSFVPADSARIGIVDKLFSRVGAKDDLFHDRSTFMVEMLETAEILQRATERSLVIMDEVGRGTTVKDGLAIAFSVVHHLVSVNRCRALFATHFHEVTDMLGYSTSNVGQGIFSGVGFFCTDIDETDDEHFAYSYRIRPGVNRDSHGLKVAQLAGMPETAIAVARDSLHWLNSRNEETWSNPEDLKTLGQRLSLTHV